MSSIGALGRDCTIPGWAVRPGAVSALRPVGEAMYLWQVIASMHGSRCNACFASEGELAYLLCRSRGALRHRLESLRKVPGLLLEVKRPRTTLGRLPTVFRWATDPFAVGHWYCCITHHRLPELAEQFGLSSDWLLGAKEHAAEHCTASKELASRIKPDLFKSPLSVSGPYGGGKGRVYAAATFKPVRPSRTKGSKKNEPTMRNENNNAGGALAWGRDSVREDAALALPRTKSTGRFSDG